jgi:formylglycine-generating enzyme required for sulfatase activity
MKTKLGLLLLMLLIAVGCGDSPQTGHPAEQPTEQAAEILARGPITNTIGMKLKLIPTGTFLMGSSGNEVGRQDGEHQHKVTISKSYYMQTTEVTQGQWTAVMGTEPWKGEDNVKEGPNYPATFVSWEDAVAFCKKLSEEEGKTYRLPTEAEVLWESSSLLAVSKACCRVCKACSLSGV